MISCPHTNVTGRGVELPVNGLRISDEQVFDMIRQTAEDARIARERTKIIQEGQKRMSNDVAVIKRCYETHEKRLVKVEYDIKSLHEKATGQMRDTNYYFGTSPVNMKYYVKWGTILGGLLLGIALTVYGALTGVGKI